MLGTKIYFLSSYGRFFFLCVCLAASLCFAREAVAEIETSPLTVEEAIAHALQDNPSLGQIKARFEALSQLPPQKGSLPDPIFHFNAMNMPTDTFDLSQEAMTQMQYGISQSIPFPGKLRFEKQASEFEATAAKYSVNELEEVLKQKVKTSWWTLFYLDRALEILAKNQEIWRESIDVATTMYEVGVGLQQDVLLAQLELSILYEQEISLKALRRQQEIQLNVLMDAPVYQPIFLSTTQIGGFKKLKDEIQLVDLSDENRPVLKEALMKINASNARVSLAKRDFFPDFNLEVLYGEREGKNTAPMSGSRSDLLTVKVGVTVPLYMNTKQSKALSQGVAEVSMEKYNYYDTKSKVSAEISAAITDYKEDVEKYELFDTSILPQARQTAASMLAGYKVDEVDFLNLMRSQIALLKYEQMYWRSVADANIALSQLVAAVGKEDIYE